MPTFFDDTESWDSVENLYAPATAPSEPVENETVGSSNHANVFNRRLEAIVNRTNWLKKYITSGILSQLIGLTGSVNKRLIFDVNGNLVAADDPVITIPENSSFSVGDTKQTILDIGSVNPYIDASGYYWYIPNGDTIGNSKVWSEKLYKALWSSPRYTVTGGKGSTSEADWAAGKTLVIPDFRGRASTMVSASRLLASQFGLQEVTLSPTHYRHRHNMSVAGFRDVGGGGIVFDNSGSFGAVALFSVPPSQINVAGNRSAASDSLGAVWENTASASTPLNLEQPSVALNYIIFTGYKPA